MKYTPSQPPKDRSPETETPRLHTNSQTISLSFESSLIQSCMRLDAPDDLVLDYTRAMMGFLLFNPAPLTILMIGLGGGSMLKYLRKHLPQAHVTAVEINQDVIDMRQDFHIPPDDEHLHIVCADGARFVVHPPRAYDIILVDGFTGEGLPEALCTRAFYQHCRRALTPGGMLVANVQADTEQTREVLSRINKAFPGGWVSVESDEGGNEIAYAGAPELMASADAQFDQRWALLAAEHQATLAAISTRVQRDLIKRIRPRAANTN